LIVAASVRLEQSGIKIGTALMRHLGDASYSLYLSHYFFIGAVIAIAGLMELDDLGRALLTPVTIATAVAVGFATFYLLERPLAGDFSTYQSIGRLLFQARLRLLQRGIAKNAAIVGETQPVRHPDAFAKANK
jgi:exopolysaccharide production protein ExoZ